MKIEEIKEPLIFIALKHVSDYIVHNIWNLNIGGDPIVEAEFNLAVAKSKKYETDIKILSQIDTDLNWGDVKQPHSTGYNISYKGDYNPWFSGNLEIEDLLNSLYDIVAIETSGDHVMQYKEFEHYFNIIREFIGDHDDDISPESNIARLKLIMTDVSTGQAKIQDKNDEYQNIYRKVSKFYSTCREKHLNKFSDLWEFYAYWKKELKTYAERRAYISRLYKKIPELKKPIPILKSQTHQYINRDRISELKGIKSTEYDLVKLLRYCEEVNIAFDNRCYLATTMLVRSILNHIPPIFKVNTFEEVTGKGSRSFKESMSSLNKSQRKIADSYLHTPIRSRETLPNLTQVDFSNDLDVLLAEVCRRLK